MPLIGIDPSLTHLGWVVFDENKIGKAAVLEMGTFITKPSDGILVQRLIMQKERLRLLLSSRGIKFVTMEAPLMKDWSTELLYALHQYLHEVFLDQKIFLIYLQPSTIKKYAYPNMDPDDISKAHMTHAAKKDLNRMGKRLSEHIADAYFAGKIGLKFYQWFFMKKFTDNDLSKQEQHLFCGKHQFVKGIKKGLMEYTGIIYRENEQFFDFSKYPRNSETIAKEITNAGKDFLAFRLL
jgi:Holliday junction resolvasome RuvABC endonuclease subunit